MRDPEYIPYNHVYSFEEDEALQRARQFRDELRARRTVRDYSTKPIPDGIIEACIESAGSAPNGANRQPWYFVVITDPDIKKEIRVSAEKEEKVFYGGKAPKEWIEALSHLGTDENKAFLEEAPALIAIFARNYETLTSGKKLKNYYVQESVGIATGMLISALHHCGLSSLTHTPSPMGFLNTILERPSNERAYILLVVGYAAENCRVPVISKKGLSEIASFR